MCIEDYHLAANQRFFFSSLLGEIGMPTYGSGGYDWLTMRDIWFDSAAIGTLGSLNSFAGDEQNSGPTPELVAKHNGLSQLLRSSNVFSVEPLDPVMLGGSTARGLLHGSGSRTANRFCSRCAPAGSTEARAPAATRNWCSRKLRWSSLRKRPAASPGPRSSASCPTAVENCSSAGPGRQPAPVLPRTGSRPRLSTAAL